MPVAKKPAAPKPAPRKRHKAAPLDITPLEVMIQAMREAYEEGGAVSAFPYAKDAAPYMHAKIQAVEMAGKDGGPIRTQQSAPDLSNLSDEELAQFAALGAKLGLTNDSGGD